MAKARTSVVALAVVVLAFVGAQASGAGVDEATVFALNDKVESLANEGLRNLEASLIAKVDDLFDAFELDLMGQLEAQFARMTETAAETTSSVASQAQAQVTGRLKMLEDEWATLNKKVSAETRAAIGNRESGVAASLAQLSSLSNEVSMQFLDYGRRADAVRSSCDAAVKSAMFKAEIRDISSRYSSILSDSKASLLQKETSVQASLGDFTELKTRTRTDGHINDGCDNCDVLIRMSFDKQRQDTGLLLTVNTGARIIGNGHQCRWFFKVNGKRCRDPRGQPHGDIDTAFHGSRNTDLHRAMYLEGVCARTESGAIGTGTVDITLGVSGNNDCYTGWSSNTRMTAREVDMPTFTYQ